jgi:protoheme ferro-lyase
VTTTESQFSIAEKEEIIARLREKLARARRDAEFAYIELTEAQEKYNDAISVRVEAEREYNLCERALLEQIEKSL